MAERGQSPLAGYDDEGHRIRLAATAALPDRSPARDAARVRHMAAAAEHARTTQATEPQIDVLPGVIQLPDGSTQPLAQSDWQHNVVRLDELTDEGLRHYGVTREDAAYLIRGRAYGPDTYVMATRGGVAIVEPPQQVQLSLEESRTGLTQMQGLGMAFPLDGRPSRPLTEADIKDFCRDQITHFKVPRHIRFVEEYPMTVTGKVQKFKMREAMVSALQGAPATA